MSFFKPSKFIPQFRQLLLSCFLPSRLRKKYTHAQNTIPCDKITTWAFLFSRHSREKNINQQASKYVGHIFSPMLFLLTWRAKKCSTRMPPVSYHIRPAAVKIYLNNMLLCMEMCMIKKEENKKCNSKYFFEEEECSVKRRTHTHYINICIYIFYLLCTKWERRRTRKRKVKIIMWGRNFSLSQERSDQAAWNTNEHSCVCTLK